VQRLVAQAVKGLRTEISTAQVMWLCYPHVRPDTAAYLLRRRRVRAALHFFGLVPVGRTYRDGAIWAMGRPEFVQRDRQAAAIFR
jgi:hypothetical protein